MVSDSKLSAEKLEKWRFPNIRGTTLGVPMMRIIMYYIEVYIDVPLSWENCQIRAAS